MGQNFLRDARFVVGYRVEEDVHSFGPTPSTSSNCKVRPWAGVRDRDAEDRPRHLRYTITGMGFRFQKPESEATQGIMRKDVDA